MTDYNGESFVAVYDHFKVGQVPGYVLSVGGFNVSLSSLGNSFSYHNRMEFSTKDRDQDQDRSRHCAKSQTGGWWYNACSETHPTGLSSLTKKYDSKCVFYHNGGERGTSWDSWSEAEYLLVPN